MSFTMPAEIAEALERRARHDMTNKSEIVRRAILAYLPPGEAAAIRSRVMEGGRASSEALATPKPVKYPKPKRGGKP